MKELTTDLKVVSNDIISISQELVIFSKTDSEQAVKLLKTVKNIQKDIKDYFDPDIKKANDLHKSLTGKKREALEPVNKAEIRIKGKLQEYESLKRKEVEEAQRKIREEEDRKERERQAKIAEEEKKLKESEGYLSPEQLAAEKQKIEDNNKKEFIPKVNVEVEEKTEGLIMKDRWSAVPVDITKIPFKYLEPNMKMLNELAKAEKDQANVPGVKFVNNPTAETRL